MRALLTVLLDSIETNINAANVLIRVIFVQIGISVESVTEIIILVYKN